MANKRTTFAKLQRERQKKAKAKAKRERRQQRSADEEETGAPSEAGSSGAEQPSAADLMERLEELHKQFDDDEITFEEFEEQKDQLLAQLATLPME